MSLNNTTHVAPPDVSILIVSYNTRALTLAAIRSVLAETKAVTFEILVVDNASGDGSDAAIADIGGPLRLMALEENIGFARANNLAAAQARGEFLLLLNPDTVIRERAIDRLVAFARARPEAKIWGGRTLFADGSLNPASCWRRMSLWNLACRATGLTGLFPNSPLFHSEAYGGWPRDEERVVDIVSGCFLLIPRTFWQRLDGFDCAFFMYGEEADLCLRARRLGARPRVTPEATIVHIGGASERVRTDKMIRLLSAKAMLIERHFSPFSAPLGKALLLLWPFSRWLALSLAYRVTGAARHGEAATTWRAVWQARNCWRSGYGRSDKVAPPARLRALLRGGTA